MKLNNNKMNWYNVTLNQFIELDKILKSEENDTEKTICLMELLFGNEITDLPLAEFNKKVKEIDFLKDEIPVKTPPKKVVVNDRTYFIDCLIGNITTAQYIDFNNHLPTGDMKKILSVFFIPEGHKYNDGYDMLQVINDIGELPIPVVESAAFFFERQLVKFMEIFQSYSIKRIKKTKMPKEQKEKVIKIIQESMDLVLSPLYLNSVK